jgi:lipoprotein-releasing system permease protein
MYMRFAWRYFKARKSTNAINIISWVSVTAILVGTASLIVILSAFNGFEGLVKSLYSTFYTDIRVIPASGKTMTMDGSTLASMDSIPGVKAVCRVVEERALLQHGGNQAVVQIKGVDRNYPQVAGLPMHMIRGAYQTGTAEDPKVVLGAGVENALGLLSDRSLEALTVYLPRKGIADMSDPLASLSQGSLLPTGSFAIQSEFDNRYAVTNLDFVRQYLGYGADEISALEVSIRNPDDVEGVRKALETLLGARCKVQDRYEQNPTLYATIRMEKWAIYAIFSLILLVAAFNMIGALSMLVLEKKKDIQVLQAMGADAGLIRRIFLGEGVLLASIGLTGGILVALTLYFLQTRFKLVKIEGKSFLIDHYPVRLVPSDFLLVSVTVLAIGLLASWFPAWRASRQPFELRN